jgi:hypothetical protein
MSDGQIVSIILMFVAVIIGIKNYSLKNELKSLKESIFFAGAIVKCCGLGDE